MTLSAKPELMPFHAMEVMREAQALEAKGRNICHLEVGEPGTPPAPNVLDAVRAALPQPQRYTNAKGTPELRARLKQYYRDIHGLEVDAENIIATMGSSAGFILAFHTAFAPGARIAVTRPGYPAYVNTLVGLGFEVVEIPVSDADGWQLSGRALAEAHARTPFDGLLFASPANPTGAVASRATLTSLVETCAELGVRLISDEIYHGLDYGAASTSALELTDNAIVINSFSKYYCMTGWRIGWMVLPDALIRRAEILQQNLFISAPSLSQIAALAALDERDYAEEKKAQYAQNRLILSEGLRRLGFELGTVTTGAFYAYAGIGRFSSDSMSFCQRMLHEAGIAATPGVDFDRIDGHNFVRFSYAGTRQTLTEALSRLETMLNAR